MNPDNRQQWEEGIVRTAIYFTLVFRIGPGNYARTEYRSLGAAIAARSGNARGMIYAVTQSGDSAMIAPNQYEQFLKLESTNK
jgi:hypothetical protein